MNFTDFNLHESLLKGVENAHYVSCTPVQEEVLKTALQGSDVYVQSQTGTGKTAAFLITIIQEMLSQPEVKSKKALVLVPTRELAVQVEEEAKLLLSGVNFCVGSFYGGVGYTNQVNLLKKGVDIIVGTPGRVIDLQESGAMDLSSVGYLVIDEADRMFDMGFYPELRKLIKVLPSSDSRQTMLFSATLNTYVKNLAWEYTREAVEITIEPEVVAVEEIHQMMYHVSSDAKMRLLLGILQSENPESLIIFCNTKKSCEIVSKRLSLNSIENEFIIGDLPQTKRLQVLDSFKRGALRCLVATDVAARGIDVEDLAMVVNYDLPVEAENYVHRIGRTARAGKQGKAYSFCSEQDVYNLPAIERYLGATIPSVVAYEEMMAEDKSAGVSLRLENYRERGNFERKRDNGRKSIGKTGSDKRDSKKTAPKTKNVGKKKNYSYQNEVDLSGLSFEERMKLYKEKYGGSQEAFSEGKQVASGGTGSPKNFEKNAAGKKRGEKSASAGSANAEKGKNRKGNKQYSGQTGSNSYRQNSGRINKSTDIPKDAERKVAVPGAKKTGFFDKLKKLFTKGK